MTEHTELILIGNHHPSEAFPWGLWFPVVFINDLGKTSKRLVVTFVDVMEFGSRMGGDVARWAGETCQSSHQEHVVNEGQFNGRGGLMSDAGASAIASELALKKRLQLEFLGWGSMPGSQTNWTSLILKIYTFVRPSWECRGSVGVKAVALMLLEGKERLAVENEHFPSETSPRCVLTA